MSTPDFDAEDPKQLIDNTDKWFGEAKEAFEKGRLDSAIAALKAVAANADDAARAINDAQRRFSRACVEAAAAEQLADD